MDLLGSLPWEYCCANLHFYYVISRILALNLFYLRDLPAMLQMLRMGTKIFIQAYEGEWADEEVIKTILATFKEISIPVGFHNRRRQSKEQCICNID